MLVFPLFYADVEVKFWWIKGLIIKIEYIFAIYVDISIIISIALDLCSFPPIDNHQNEYIRYVLTMNQTR